MDSLPIQSLEARFAEAIGRCHVVVTVSGTRKAPPPSTYLPAWPGWRVVHREKSRIHVVRPGR